MQIESIAFSKFSIKQGFNQTSLMPLVTWVEKDKCTGSDRVFSLGKGFGNVHPRCICEELVRVQH